MGRYKTWKWAINRLVWLFELIDWQRKKQYYFAAVFDSVSLVDIFNFCILPWVDSVLKIKKLVKWKALKRKTFFVSNWQCGRIVQSAVSYATFGSVNPSNPVVMRLRVQQQFSQKLPQTYRSLVAAAATTWRRRPEVIHVWRHRWRRRPLRLAAELLCSATNQSVSDEWS